PAVFRIVRIGETCQGRGLNREKLLMKRGHDDSFAAVTRSRGFTLIELAAVAGVLAVLALLVLPALAKGNGASRESLCLSNHRQLARACILYAQDFENRLPNNYTIPENVRCPQSVDDLAHD